MLEELRALCTPRLLLHFERTGDGDGWSVLCEGAGSSHGLGLYASIRSSFLAGFDGKYEPPPEGAAEITIVGP